MNRQKKIVKSVCIAGLAGVLAAGGTAVHGSVKTFTEGLAAGEGEVIILTPENMEALKARLAQNPGLIVMLEDGTQIDLAYLETLEALGQTIILKEADVAANPEILGDLEDPGVPETLVGTDSPAENAGESDNAENPGTAETPEDAEETGTPEDPGTAETPGDSETPGISDEEDGASEDKGELGGSEEPDTGETPEDTEKPGDEGSEAEKPGTAEKPTEDSDKPGESGKPGEDGVSGDPEEAGDSDKPGISDGSGEAGDIEKPGTPGSSGDSEDIDRPGSSDNLDYPENPDGSEGYDRPDVSENPGSSDISKKPGASGDSEASDNIYIQSIMNSSNKDTGFGSVPDKILVEADQFTPELITPERISNATVILNRKLVKLPKIVEDFRFWTVTRRYAFAKEDLIIQEKIPEEEAQEEGIRAVGSLKQDGLLYILKEENNGWLYVESGRVRGFVRPEMVMTGEEASQRLEEYQKEAKQKAEEEQVEYTGIEDTVPMAEELISWKDNEAFTYLRATVDQTVVEKRYAVAEDAPAEVLEEKDISSRTIGVLPKGGLCYVLEGELKEPEDEAQESDDDLTRAPEEVTEDPSEEAADEPEEASDKLENVPPEASDGLESEAEEIEDISEDIPEETVDQLSEEEEWLYVESGDVRGFVRRESLRYGEEITKRVEEEKEESFLLAEEKIKPEDNAACYYTLTSTKSGVPSGEIRRSMIEFAAQFIGNPYVWGGTSLTDGADCSGFVQSIYKQYGYDIPRVACDQAEYGIKIPVEDALPGDLIFYARNGYIHHVVMYAGDGKTIEAMSSLTGIVQADVREDSAVWATRVLDDNGYEYEGGGISEVNAAPDMYGRDLGTFELTYYCACELCCDVETGITATGAPVVEGRTIAVDPRVIPYGTKVIIGGHIFTAEDCGGAIKGNHIDVYVNDHAKALALGVNYANVYLKK